METSRATRLRGRREDIVTTLAYLARERDEIERNQVWMDTRAQQRRRVLLADVSAWYDSKLRQIDYLVERISRRSCA